MSDKTKRWLWGIGIVVGILLFSYISIRNQLITLHESVDASWGQVENQLQRGYDLIPNLVETAKGYAKQEQKVFGDIAASRAQLAGARTINDRVAASNQMESSLARLLVISENYPNLKSDQTFMRLMDELSGSENRISVERRRFNENVQAYNNKVIRFPGSLVAGQLGYKKLEYFTSAKGAENAPKVQF
jgi:LemA protein